VRKFILLTIDTEGDNLWKKPARETSKNGAFIPRFQALCDKYDFKPTYLCDYVIAHDKTFQLAARSWLKKGVCEIGMHLHAWNTPPIASLTRDDYRQHPFLINFEEALMREKIAVMTKLLTDVFNVNPLSHRAGRWAFDDRYARLLDDFGYKVDCSVTPLVSWKHQTPGPGFSGGTDYRRFPSNAYFIDLNDISNAGSSDLLEIPMTIRHSPFTFSGALRRFANRLPLGPRWASKTAEKVGWLRPNGKNRKSLLEIVTRAARERREYIEFMIHSSEFMPGGSPYFPDANSVEVLFEDMETLFAFAKDAGFEGATLMDYYAHYSRSHKN
jgi:hypothetical protein